MRAAVASAGPAVFAAVIAVTRLATASLAERARPRSSWPGSALAPRPHSSPAPACAGSASSPKPILRVTRSRRRASRPKGAADDDIPSRASQSTGGIAHR
jgi:hypothetical protein